MGSASEITEALKTEQQSRNDRNQYSIIRLSFG